MKVNRLLPIVLLSMCITGCEFGGLTPSGDDKTFSVNLTNSGDVNLVLSEKSSFANTSDKLELYNTPGLLENTYLQLPDIAELDNEDTDYQSAKHSEYNALKYLKYTFYVKNIGASTATYDLSVNIMENTPSSDGRTIDHIIRVMLCDNSDASHQYNVYAKESATTKPTMGLEPGETTNKEYISLSPEQASERGVEFPGFAEKFESQNIVTSRTINDFKQGDVRRYTFISWIEGEDPEDVGLPMDNNARLVLGINITARQV